MALSTLDLKTALLIVDLQKGLLDYPFIHPIGEVVERARTLIDAFRAEGLPVVLINVAGGAPGRTERQHRMRKARAEDFSDLIAELGQTASDLIVTKRSWGAFAGTGLEAQLKTLGVTQVVVSGISTHTGVESTARQAYEAGFNVALAIDAMTDGSADAHDYSVRNVFPRLGDWDDEGGPGTAVRYPAASHRWRSGYICALAIDAESSGAGMKIVTFEEAPRRQRDPSVQTEHSRDHGESEGRRTLAEIAPDGLRFHLGRGIHKEGKAPFRAPRHHHAFQQVRWCDSGRKNYAPGKYIEAGDVAYFPKGAYYGPEVKDGAYTGWSTQFGFDDQHQLGPDWEPFRKEARANLRARGVMENGRYTPVDPETGERGEEMDGVQAVYAETVRLRSKGRDMYVIPPEGYDAPIVMHPAAFAYYPVTPGVEMKRLGCFYDHPGEHGDTRIMMLRLNEGGVFTLSAERNQIGMTLGDGLQVDGDQRIYPAQTSFYSPIGETLQLRGTDDTELYVVELPRRD